MMSRSDLSSGRRASIVIVDDHSLIAAALRDLIIHYSCSATVHSCSSLASALSALQSVEPDLVILDLVLPDAQGTAVVSAVRRAAPDANIAVISGNDDLAYAIPEIQTGQVRFLKKGATEHELKRGIVELLRCCGLAGDTHHSTSNGESGPAPQIASLSPRQRQILRLLATGRSNNEIAEALHISVETIKTHLHEIFTKLQVKNRTQAVLLYRAAYEETDNGNGSVG